MNSWLFAQALITIVWLRCGGHRQCPLRAEQVPADSRHVAEDAYAQDHHDAGGQLPADAELVAEPHDQAGDEDVGDERDDELLVVEDSVELRAYAAEDRVQRGDHRDGQVRLQRGRDGGVQDDPEDDPGDEGEDGNHLPPPVLDGDGAGLDFSVDGGADGELDTSGWA